MHTQDVANPADILVQTDRREAAGDLAHLTADQSALLDQARGRLMTGDSAATHAVTLVLDETIKVPVYRWDSVQSKFARLVARAEKSGAPVPQLTELSRDDEWVTASILGGAPVFKGWSLVADLERRVVMAKGSHPLTTKLEETNIVRLARGVDSIPARFRDAPEQCTECGVSRKRNRTFIVSHADEGFAQLGSTCVKRYLGPEALRAWLTWGALQDAVDEFGNLGWDEDEFANYRGKVEDWGQPVEPMRFLEAVCAEARVHGFASAGSSLHANMATGRSVWASMQTATHEPVTDEDRARSVEVATMVDILSGEFGRTVDTILRSRVEWRDANTLAALYSIHAREAAKCNEHVPHCSPGSKVVLDLTVVSMPTWVENDFSGYGLISKWRVNFVDADGRGVTWVTSSPNTVDDDALEVGDSVRVTSTVKALGDYKGMAQTTLSRPSVRAADEVTKSAPAMRKWAKASGFPCPAWAWTKAQQKRAAKAAA